MLNWYMLEKAMCSHDQAANRYAENRRLLREALEARPEVARPYDQALAMLGHWLIDRGQRLQERHADKNLPAAHTPMRVQSLVSASRRNQDCTAVEG